MVLMYGIGNVAGSFSYLQSRLFQLVTQDAAVGSGDAPQS